MLAKFLISAAVLASASFSNVLAAPASKHGMHLPPVTHHDEVITPKAFIISMFSYEQNVWLEPLELTKNISIPNLSPIYPYIHCNEELSICQMTTGEAEINAASTVSALMLSSQFDLRKTYFLIAGIAGVNPYWGTTGSVALAQYAVQLELEYELDAREMPANWTTGLWGLGANAPGEYPISIYGTEVFELNLNLRQKVIDLAKGCKLNDTETAIEFRALYDYAPANEPPSIITCDTGSSNAFWHGSLLGESFGNYTQMITNGTGNYCMTAQEDSASLEAMLRATLAGRVDFSRIALMRTGSNFDRPPNDETAYYNLITANMGGFDSSLANIYIVGSPFIKDVVKNWHEYENGIKPDNYIGDILGSLGGTPNFGPSAAVLASIDPNFQT
ncbi:hypothetical protein Unana1_08337 [Umbelopsis nana]